MHICFLFVYAWAEALFDNQMVSWKTYPKLAFGLYFTGEFLQNTIDTKITVLLDVRITQQDIILYTHFLSINRLVCMGTNACYIMKKLAIVCKYGI